MMPDPYYRENELEAVKLADNDFEYRKCFALHDENTFSFSSLIYFVGECNTTFSSFSPCLTLSSTSIIRGGAELKRYDLNGSWELKVLGENVYHIPEEYVEAKSPLPCIFPHAGKYVCAV